MYNCVVDLHSPKIFQAPKGMLWKDLKKKQVEELNETRDHDQLQEYAGCTCCVLMFLENWQR